ncbi:MAG: glucose-1-phosphate cytidylyltransferase [Kiritimatiellia bacterium]
MKVVILAGGLGTRLGEETGMRPKPMVAIGGYPILWHIMKIYSHYGFNEFVVLCGYKSEVIKEYFVNYYMNNSDVTVDLSTNNVEVHNNTSEPWKVTMFYTGRNTMTGARIKKVKAFIGNEPFMLTYGDGVSDVDINKVVESHKNSGKLATVTAILPSGRFGALEIAGNGSVSSFKEKPRGDGFWINGGFFVCEPGIFDYIPEGEDVVWEQEPLKRLVEEHQLNSYKHHGFWRPMDTLKDKEDLNKMWAEGIAPWKLWDK